MSSKHLAAGSECPPRDDKKLRLYSMLFCPFCERVRMILLLKKLPHDIVNINQKDKPEWLYRINDRGKLPALDTGVRIVTESQDIAEFLELICPNPPLFTNEPDKEKSREKDKAVMDLFAKVLEPFFAVFHDKDNKSLDEYMEDIYTVMDPIEAELASRGTLFFGGDSPMFLDYMIWPFTERSKVPSIVFNQPFNFPKERFKHMVKWRCAMKEQPVVQECWIAPERHAKLVLAHRRYEQDKTPVDYDSI